MDLRLNGEWEGVVGTVDIIYVSDDDRFDSIEDFPPIGTTMDAVTLVVMSSGQLRLSTRRSDLRRLGGADLVPVSDGTSRRVRGTVTRHEEYGFYLDFGGDREGVVVIPMINRSLTESGPIFPAIGSVIDAILLGYTELDGEPRLSIRPQDLEDSKT